VIYIPNWFVHTEWAKKAGIDIEIANSVNRTIDYGFNWSSFDDQKDGTKHRENEKVIFKQLLHFYEKTKHPEKYIKACYLHHLLDFFKETHVNIYDLNLVFQKFLENKVISEIIDSQGENVDFKPIISEIFQLIEQNAKKLYQDLRGPYLTELKEE
jgi:hypothetical protein